MCASLLLMLSAPVLATTANDLCAPNTDPCVVSTPVSVTTLSVIDVGQRELRIDGGGALDVGSGTMTIRAQLLTVNLNGFVRASGTTSTAGGTITIEAGSVAVTGSVDASGTPGGTVRIFSTGDVSINGATGLVARSLSRAEVGGTVDVNAANFILTGTLSVLGGSEDAIGGDATVNATESVVITGTIDASGGDGGAIDITAGFMPGAGDVVIGDTAALKVDATTGGGFGGTIDVVANGVDSRGHVMIEGTLSATGRTAGVETGGGSGGCITIDADGDIINTGRAATITAAGGGPDGDGGELELTADHGEITLACTLQSGSPGSESSGGSITIDSGRRTAINGTLSVTGGDGGGGEVSIRSTGSNVEIQRMGTVTVDAQSGGTGGAICIESGVGEGGPRAIVVEGGLSARGGASAGAGGTIELAGGDAVRVAATGSLRAPGATGGGRGGSILVDVTAGPAFIDGTLVADGGSPTGAGGMISVDANQNVVVTAVVDTRGPGVGGEIGLASTGSIDVRGNLLASSTAGSGGSIEIVSEGEVMIASSLVSDGMALPGGRVDVQACTITVCGAGSAVCPSGGAGVLSSLGPDGRNRTIGRDETVILGTMRAASDSGHNQLLYDGNPEHEPFILGSVIPSPEVIVSSEVRACPACGNSIIDPPETCDDGNQLDGDGCSRTCQVEMPIPGDANGDFTVSESDRGAAAAEIFDGDGTAADMVGGGTFPGGLGTDANDDGLVTAADLVAITGLLAP